MYENGGFSAQLSGDYTDIQGTSAKVFRSLNAGSVGDSLTLLWNFVPAAFLADLQDNGAVDGSLPPIPGLPTVPYSILDGNGPVTAALDAGSLRSQSGNSPNSINFTGGGTSLRLEQDFGNAKLRSITAYREFKSLVSQDQDGLPQNLAFGTYDDRQNQFSQELNVYGTTGDGNLDWLVGAYYFHESAKADQLIAVAYPFFAINNRFNTTVDSYAAFTEATWRFADRWSLVAGLRYTNEKKDFDITSNCRPEMVLPICPGGFYVPSTQASESWNSFDPRFGIQYRPSDDWMIYAQYSTGFKSGGFNARPSTAVVARTPYNPETLDAFEGGVKGRLLDGRATFRAASFFYKYNNLQFTVSGLDRNTGAPLSVSGNLGNAEMLGLEVETTLRPTSRLTLDAAFGLLDAHYTSLDPTLLAIVSSSGQGALTLDSNLPKAPAFTANIGLQYDADIGEGMLTPRVDFSYVSKQYSDAQNFDLTASPKHTNVNARVSYVPRNGRWSFSVYAKNLLNETYVSNGFWPSGGANSRVFLTPNEPREIGATFGLNF
jgi:iron complex outermembrane receptor protein